MHPTIKRVIKIAESLNPEDSRVLLNFVDDVIHSNNRASGILRDCQLMARESLSGECDPIQALKDIEHAVSANYPQFDHVPTVDPETVNNVLNDFVQQGLLVYEDGNYKFTDEGYDYCLQHMQSEPESRDLLRRILSGDAKIPNNIPDID